MQAEERESESTGNELPGTPAAEVKPEAHQEQTEEKPTLEGEEEQPAPRRLRRFLIWAVGLLLLFAFGVVAAWFIQIQPMRERNRVLQSDLVQAQQQVESLTLDVERLQPLEAENEALQERVVKLESHIFLLDVLVDVTKAQLALVEEDAIAAADALQGTNQRLEQLEQRLSSDNSDTVRGMKARLALAIEEVETDEFAARRDLEILANDLIALEQQLFGE